MALFLPLEPLCYHARHWTFIEAEPGERGVDYAADD